MNLVKKLLIALPLFLIATAGILIKSSSQAQAELSLDTRTQTFHPQSLSFLLAEVPTDGGLAESPPLATQTVISQILLATVACDPEKAEAAKKKCNELKEAKKLDAEELNDTIITVESWLNRDYEACDTSAIQGCSIKIKKYKERVKEFKACDDTVPKMSTALKEYTTACSKFSSGKLECHEAVEACSICPSVDDSEEKEENDEEDDEDDKKEDKASLYNCIKVRQQTQCPARLGPELERVEKRKEKVQDEIKDIKDKITSKEEELATAKNDLQSQLSDLETTFIDIRNELEVQVNQSKADLESELKTAQASVEEAVTEKIAQVQQQLNESLKISHEFENAISSAHLEYRQEMGQIYRECEAQAQAQLAQYRQRRRQAIESGTFRISVSNLMNKGRMSFSDQDRRRYSYYKSLCHDERRRDFEDVKIARNQKLKVIDQQRLQYQTQLENLKQQFAGINQQALQAKQKQVADYASQMKQVIEQHQQLLKVEQQKYQKQKQSLMSQSQSIVQLQQQLVRLINELRMKERELVQAGGFISELKNRGVHSGTEQESEYETVASSLPMYTDVLKRANHTCGCSTKEQLNTAHCKEIAKGLFSIGMEEAGEQINKKLPDESQNQKSSGGNR